MGEPPQTGADATISTAFRHGQLGGGESTTYFSLRILPLEMTQESLLPRIIAVLKEKSEMKGAALTP